MRSDVERLIAIVTGLSTEDLASLMAFAEFLATRPRGPRYSASSATVPESAALTAEQFAILVNASKLAAPVSASEQSLTDSGMGPASGTRVKGESVVAAIKRLVADHPHLERRELLHDAAQLMENFITGACSNEQTIARLEALFAARSGEAAGSPDVQDPSREKAEVTNSSAKSGHALQHVGSKLGET